MKMMKSEGMGMPEITMDMLNDFNFMSKLINFVWLN